MTYVVREGYKVDPKTGLIVDEVVFDDGIGFRAYSYEEYLERVHSIAVNPLLHDFNVGSTFDVDRDADGHRIPYHIAKKYLKLKELLNETRVYRRKSEVRAFGLLIRLCGRLMLPHTICIDASMKLRGMLGHGQSEMVALKALASALAAYGHPAYYEVLEIAKEMGFGNLKVETKMDDVRMTLALIEKLGREFKLSNHAIGLASRLALHAIKRVTGTRPRTIACGSLYIAAKLNDYMIGEKQLAKSVGISEASVRSFMKRAGFRVKLIINDLTYEWRVGSSYTGLLTPTAIVYRDGVPCSPSIPPRRVTITNNLEVAAEYECRT